MIGIFYCLLTLVFSDRYPLQKVDFICLQTTQTVDYFRASKLSRISPQTRQRISCRQLFFIDNYMWSITKKHGLWGKLSTTKCKNVKLSTTRSFPCEKRETAQLSTINCCRKHYVSDCFLSSVGLNHSVVDNYHIYVRICGQLICQKTNMTDRK